MAINQFNTNEVRMIVWVKRADLESWIKEGYVVPSNYEEAACGKRYLWSREDIYRLAAFKELVESGLKPLIAHDVLKGTDELPDNIKSSIDNKIETVFGK